MYMSDLDNQDSHKAKIQQGVRDARAQPDTEQSKLSDTDDQQDNKSRAAPNLTFPNVLKKTRGENEVE